MPASYNMSSTAELITELMRRYPRGLIVCAYDGSEMGAWCNCESTLLAHHMLEECRNDVSNGGKIVKPTSSPLILPSSTRNGKGGT